MREHFEETKDAFGTVVRVVLDAIEDRRIDDQEAIKIVDSLRECDRDISVVDVDEQHLTACMAMIGTLTRTWELTPKVVRKLHEQERDLLQVEKSNLAYINNIAELFPRSAA